ncbi:MAG: hypothetical protein QM784_27640 [Polyangiaceae bacterium]
MKKLIILALASTTVFNLAACGESSEIVIDDSILTDGSSNANKLGGYWWTYVDRTGKSEVVPDTGKVDPKDAASTALKDGIKDGNGIADDGTGNKALHVMGSVAVAPKWKADLGSAVQTDGSDWRDPYVDANYGFLCQDNTCKEVAYPSSGLGMGFLKGNAPLGQKAVGKVGLAFKIKLGVGHGKNPADGASYPIAMSLPMDLTDVPDPSFGDTFGTEYGTGTPHSGVAATPGKNQPFCSFPGSLTPAGTPVGGTNKTCFANLATIISPTPTADWTKYCVKFTDFAPPAWAKGLLLPEVNVTAVIPERIIKLQFDAHKPPEAATEPAAFDFWVDDVILLDDAKFATECAGATPVVPTPVP